MNINRHNYEEYFILYMDNELGMDDRGQVEAFVQKNPDLREELDILLQYKLVPDTNIIYPGKQELMMPDAVAINPNPLVNPANYEAWLLLYADNELTTDQQIAVEQFMSSHPFAKEELVLLHRTKLQPETIIFAHKESLYRKEEKVRPLPFYWRVAAAAILILAVGFTLFIVLNKRSPAVTPGLAKTPVNEQKINEPGPAITISKKNTPVINPVIIERKKQVLTTPLKYDRTNIAIKNNSLEKKPATSNQVLPKKEEPVMAVSNENKPSNNLPKPLNNSNFNGNASKSDVVNVNPSKEIRNTPIPSTDHAVTTKPIAPSYVKSTTSDNDVADLSQSEKKGKLRGFFRKVARTLEKRTNIDPTDDDKLLVGGLAFKLK